MRGLITRALLALLALSFIAPAQAQVDPIALVAKAQAAQKVPLPSLYLGQVATRAFAPNALAASSKSVNFQAYHFATEDISAISLEYANWYADLTTPFEHLTGATPTLTVYVSYPPGSSWQVLKWSGSGSHTFADGEDTATDVTPLTTTIPKGAMFLSCVHGESANGFAIYNYPNQNFQTAGNNNPAVANQIWDASGTLAGRSDICATNTAPASTSGSVQNSIMPVAILAYTRNASFCIFGDSRAAGTGDRDANGFVDGTGDTGDLARSIGRRYGDINLATSGDKLQNFLTAHTKRSALAKRCSAVAGFDLINDVNGARTTAQLAADLGTFLGLSDFAGKKIFLVTTSPNPDATNTTPNSNDAARTGVNDKLRSGQIKSSGGIMPTGVWDIASVNEAGHNTGLWGTHNGRGITDTNAPTQLHNNYDGYMDILKSGIVDVSKAAR